jgi:hypothetical protein
VLLVLVADCVRTFVDVDVMVVEALTEPVALITVEVALVSVGVGLP